MCCDKAKSDSSIGVTNRRVCLGTALLLGVVTMCAGTVPGQTGKGGGYRPSNRVVRRPSLIDTQVERLTKRLDLSKPQQVAVRKILEHQRQQIAAVWDDPAIEPIARTYKLRDLQDNAVKEIRTVLNDEQKKKYFKVPEHKPGDSETLQKNYNQYVGAR